MKKSTCAEFILFIQKAPLICYICNVMKNKTFIIIFLTILLGGLAFVATANIVIDPIFHYHAPLKGVSYKLDDERYQNNGIVKHFDYDAIITGTSMTENFKTSQLDSLFGTKSIKTCFMGGSYLEISDNIRTALEYNPQIKLVVRATDQFDIINDPNKHPSTDPETTFEYPWYIIDNNPFNDVEYVLNKSLFSDTLNNIKATLTHTPSTTFDEYMNWESNYTFGKATVLSTYARPEITGENVSISENERSLLMANVQQNIIDLAEDYPEVTFYIWIPPYSVCYYDQEIRAGKLLRDLDAMETEIKMLVDVQNIKLFGFADREDIVTNLDLYKDVIHYDSSVNEEVLNCMAEGKGLLTVDNYESYMKKVRDFYINYDYDSIYE